MFAEPLDADRSQVTTMHKRLEAQAMEMQSLQSNAKEHADAIGVIMEMLEDTMPIQVSQTCALLEIKNDILTAHVHFADHA